MLIRYNSRLLKPRLGGIISTKVIRVNMEIICTTEYSINITVHVPNTMYVNAL